jgi:hypothetical protein
MTNTTQPMPGMFSQSTMSNDELSGLYIAIYASNKI